MGVDQSVSEGRKRWILSIRTTAGGRKRLADAAEGNGRSLSEEIESRLQKTFHLDDSAGGFASAAFFDLLGAFARDAEAVSGKSWQSDHETWRSVRGKVVAEFDLREPDQKSSRGRTAKRILKTKPAKPSRNY